MRDITVAAGLPPPEFECQQGEVLVRFRPATGRMIGPPTPQVVPQVGTKSAPCRHQVTPQVTPQVAAILKAAFEGPRLREELQKAVGLRDREHFRKGYLEPLLTVGWLERTIPDKPRSSRQRYRTTAAGQKVVEKKDLR